MPTTQPGACAPGARDFPALVRTALARIAGSDAGGLAELDHRQRGLLARLVRNVCAKAPETAIRVSNAALAAGLHVSERTVLRLKTSLVHGGWITRRQVQSRRFGMQIADVWLSPRALATLGLVMATATEAGAEVVDGQAQDALLRPPEMANALLASGQSLERQPPEGGSVDNLSQEPTPARSGVLPDDVQLLAADGRLSVPGVRLLMGLARDAGHRLGDIVAVAGSSILQARNRVAYVRRLLTCDTDWSAKARAQRGQCDEDRMPGRRVAELNALVEAMGESMFSHERQRYAWRVEHGLVHQSTVADAARGGIGRWLPLVDLTGFAGAWHAGKIFPVTHDDLVAWEAEPAVAAAPLAPAETKAGAKEALTSLRERLLKGLENKLTPQRCYPSLDLSGSS